MIRGRELRDVMSTQFKDRIVESGREARRSGLDLRILLKRGVQVTHLLIGFGFVILAVTEFFRNPPYFDVIRNTKNDSSITPRAFYNATRDDRGEIRRVMDLPILFMFLTYFCVLVWKKGWGVWSMLMTFSLSVMLFVFLLVNYIAINIFDWRYFVPRGSGILLQVFSIALCWDCIACTVFTRVDYFPFSFLTDNKPPKTILQKILLVLWNFACILIFLFLCLLIWFSRLYYSWVCARSLDDVLLMCQFTNLVQCYSCEEAAMCTNLEICVNTAKVTFHCETPLALLHRVENALCIFNYNIGFFTFIMVFAYVGGTYFFLVGSFSFVARLMNIVMTRVIKFMRNRATPHVSRIRGYSLSKRRHVSINKHDEDENDSDDELLLNHEATHHLEQQGSIQAISQDR